MLEEREKNLAFLDYYRRGNLYIYKPNTEPLSKDLSSKLDRIQKFLNQLRNISSAASYSTHSSELNKEMLVQEVHQLNLRRHISEVVKAIAQGKLNIRDQDVLIEICLIMNQKYEDFAN